MDTTLQQIDGLFAEWDRADSPGCALAIIKDGAVVYKRGYGQATLEYDVPITPATIFHVASVSKQFTAFAIALLVLDGRLALDDDARRYLPELPDFGATITIRHLIHHTSGLRDQWDLLIAAGWRMSDVITTSDILELAQNQRELNFLPGAEHVYCNTGYTLLALIVERVGGQPFREFCAQRIFDLLGMHNTHFHDDHTRVVKNRAYSYTPSGGGRFRNAVLSYATAGATSLFTTVEDLALWDRNFYEGKVGGQPAIDLMHTTGVLNDGSSIPYAFGLSIGTYSGLRTVEHAGGDAGFRSMLMRFPEQRCSVIILGNLANADTTTLSKKVADIVLADQFKEPSTQQPERAAPQAGVNALVYEDAASLAGVYFDPVMHETLLLEARDAKLVIPIGPGLELMPLEAGHYHLADAPLAQFRFVTSPDGQEQVMQSYAEGKPNIYNRMAPAHPTVDQLGEYTGRYYSPELDVTYVIRLKETRLVLHQRKYGDGALLPTFGDAFKCDMTEGMGMPASVDVMFQRRDGRVSGFMLNAGRIRNVRFDRL